MAEDSSQVGARAESSISVPPIPIDQFIALNDELAAVVRAGLPMERSLREAASEMPGTLGTMMQLLADRMSHGESLPKALASERNRFPHVYRAVVEAGIKSGRLTAALEGIATFARIYVELRRAIGMALLYPFMVLTFAYALLVFFVLEIVPRFLEAYDFFRLQTHQVSRLLRETLPYWVAGPPALLLLIAIWWIRSGRVMALQPAWTRRSLGWIPWLQGILANSRSACFSELLALLVDHEVPLPESIRLAADATGDESIMSSARDVSDAIERGDSLTSVVRSITAFPPMLRWLMVTGLERGALAQALRHSTKTYRELALHQSNVVRQILPVVLLMGVGATSAFIYCVLVFEPFTALLHQLSYF
jgi:general secretion pathway protein F